MDSESIAIIREAVLSRFTFDLINKEDYTPNIGRPISCYTSQTVDTSLNRLHSLYLIRDTAAYTLTATKLNTYERIFSNYLIDPRACVDDSSEVNRNPMKLLNQLRAAKYLQLKKDSRY